MNETAGWLTLTTKYIQRQVSNDPPSSPLILSFSKPSMYCTTMHEPQDHFRVNNTMESVLTSVPVYPNASHGDSFYNKTFDVGEPSLTSHSTAPFWLLGRLPSPLILLCLPITLPPAADSYLR